MFSETEWCRTSHISEFYSEEYAVRFEVCLTQLVQAGASQEVEAHDNLPRLFLTS